MDSAAWCQERIEPSQPCGHRYLKPAVYNSPPGQGAAPCGEPGRLRGMGGPFKRGCGTARMRHVRADRKRHGTPRMAGDRMDGPRVATSSEGRFLGRHLVQRLRSAASRADRPGGQPSARARKDAGLVGQVCRSPARSPTRPRLPRLDGAEVAINLVGTCPSARGRFMRARRRRRARGAARGRGGRGAVIHSRIAPIPERQPLCAHKGEGRDRGPAAFPEATSAALVDFGPRPVLQPLRCDAALLPVMR